MDDVEAQKAVLDFWFPKGAGKDVDTHKEYWMFRMRGGADAEIVERFTELTERAAQGELDDWADEPRGRLALIIVLDQFSRSVWRDSPQAYAQDPKSVKLVLEGLENGHYDALETVWEKTFYGIALGHCEGPDHLERCDKAIALAKQILEEAPEHLKMLYRFSAEQPVLTRQVIEAFGRHPHRNAILGRDSTDEELDYLRKGEFPHTREVDL